MKKYTITRPNPVRRQTLRRHLKEGRSVWRDFQVRQGVPDSVQNVSRGRLRIRWFEFNDHHAVRALRGGV